MEASELVEDIIPALLTPGVWRYFAARVREPEAQVAICMVARLALEMSDHDLFAYLSGQPSPPTGERRRQARRMRARRQSD